MYIYVIQRERERERIPSRATVSRLCNRIGLRGRSVTKQSKHLDYSHPSMESVRDYVSIACETERIDPRLLGNFDQVWSVHYEAPRRVMHKHESQAGQIVDSDYRKRSLQKIRASISESLGMAGCGQQAQVVPKDDCKKMQLDAAGNLNPVDYARQARTLTTLSWADGDLGRAWVTIQPGSVQNPQLLMDLLGFAAFAVCVFIIRVCVYIYISQSPFGEGHYNMCIYICSWFIIMASQHCWRPGHSVIHIEVVYGVMTCVSHIYMLTVLCQRMCLLLISLRCISV